MLKNNTIRSDPKKILRQVVSKFVSKEITPNARELDQKKHIPTSLLKKIAGLGIFGIRYPIKEGGSGGNSTLYCIICEEFAKGLLSLAAKVAKQCLMGTEHIYRFGTEELKKKYFFPAMKGEKIGSFCLTEPEAGGDLASLLTTAKKKGSSYWIINGVKTWITNAPSADFFTVLAQTDSNKGIKGLNFFFVPRSTPGVSVGQRFETLGTRSSDIAEVSFNNCKIPKDYILGQPGEGFKSLLSILAEIRSMTAALALGLAQSAYETSFKYAQERQAFGKTINKYQLIQKKITDMATNIWATKLMLYETTQKIDAGFSANKESMMVKYFATETACQCCDEATRILGAYAYSMDYPVQRYFRDARFLLYGGGTHEILQQNIAKILGC